MRRRNIEWMMLVLIIEDNRDGAESLRLLLEILGHEARVAYSGLDGVRLAKECLPALVVSDIGLPGMDGFEVARTLRQNEALSKAKLIALTAYSDEDTLERAHTSGFDDVLVKPSSLEALLEYLRAGA
jgi:CheY-like chemotaxis protein